MVFNGFLSDLVRQRNFNGFQLFEIIGFNQSIDVITGKKTFFEVEPSKSLVTLEPTDAGSEIFFVLPSFFSLVVLSLFSASPASSDWSRSSWRGTEAGRGVTLPFSGRPAWISRQAGGRGAPAQGNSILEVEKEKFQEQNKKWCYKAKSVYVRKSERKIDHLMSPEQSDLSWVQVGECKCHDDDGDDGDDDDDYDDDNDDDDADDDDGNDNDD